MVHVDQTHGIDFSLIEIYKKNLLTIKGTNWSVRDKTVWHFINIRRKE